MTNNYTVYVTIQTPQRTIREQVYGFDSLDEMRNLDFNALVNSAEDIEKEMGANDTPDDADDGLPM